MAQENRLWGAERIRGELLKLGIKVSKRTIQRYLPKYLWFLHLTVWPKEPTQFSHKADAKIKKISLETAYYEAISNPKSDFGVDDLNLLIGNFKGDHKKLAKISKMKCRIYEVGISYYGRTYEEGKKIGWRDGVKALYCIIKYNLFR